MAVDDSQGVGDVEEGFRNRHLMLEGRGWRKADGAARFDDDDGIRFLEASEARAK